MTAREVLGPQLCSRLRKLPNQTGAGSPSSEGTHMWGESAKKILEYVSYCLIDLISGKIA